MSDIHNIPNITTNGGGIPYIPNSASIQVDNAEVIQVNGTGIQFVQNIKFLHYC